MEKIRHAANHVLCIFPFEPELLQKNGIDATFVGHPLASVIPMEPDKAAARAALGLPANATLVAILPGSRQSEIRHLGQRFLAAAAHVARVMPAVRFMIPVAPGFQLQIQDLVQRSGLADKVHVFEGKSHQVLAACDVTLIASGTATLEAALFKRPMVISYHQSWLSWRIMQRKRLQPWVGLPNILCREFVVPELLQDEATPERLAQAVLRWLDGSAETAQRIAVMRAKFVTMHHELTRDTATIATDVFEKILQN